MWRAVEPNRILGTWSAIAAFAFCLGGGLWLLVFGGFDTSDPIVAGLGLYFVGKVFFVGPMLYHTAKKA